MPTVSVFHIIWKISMEKSKKYLTFRLHDFLLGIDAAAVQEIFPLPELVPAVGINGDIIGTLNFRGQVVPVIHLHWLYDHPLESLQLSHYLIVLKWEGLLIGMVVHQVNEMLEIDTDCIETAPFDKLFDDIDTTLITGIAKVEPATILLLNLAKLIRQPDTLVTLLWDTESQLEVITASEDGQQYREEYQKFEEIQTPNFYDLYCPNVTSQEKGIFRQRALQLRKTFESSEETLTNKLIPLAVIGFGSEYFGLDLELVREFTDIYNLTPIPCCPKHIVGNMNLRGEIVTLVDIRKVLNIPMTPVSPGSKAVVVQVEDIVAGLPVDTVMDVVYLNHADMTSLKATAFTDDTQYFRSLAPFAKGMLCVLDLPKILTKGGLIVNEEIY